MANKLLRLEVLNLIDPVDARHYEKLKQTTKIVEVKELPTLNSDHRVMVTYYETKKVPT